jgi:hypothetical protein
MKLVYNAVLDNYYSKTNIVNIINEKSISVEDFRIYKQLKNEGDVKYCSGDNYKYSKKRVFQIIWYLNDIEEGGETDFLGYYKIKPKKGDIVVFPSEWFFPYCENTSLSHDKYILYGYIYIDIQ